MSTIDHTLVRYYIIMPNNNIFKPFYLLLFGFFFAAIVYSEPNSCSRGKQIMWFYPSEKLDVRTAPGFSSQVLNDLKISMEQIGYCLIPYIKTDTIPDSAQVNENPVLYLFLTETRPNRAPASEVKEPELVVVITTLKDANKGSVQLSSLRPLMSISFGAEDIENIRVIFEKKIIENLRTQFICNLTITSDPAGVTVTSLNGLSDVTPLEWVVPVGKLNIQCKRDNYMPYKKDISLNRPGTYNYFLQLKKKQFYNSKFFLPALGMWLAAGVSYGLERYYYYEKYEKLTDPNDEHSFETFFNTAKTCETVATTCLSLCVSMICLSFWF